MRDKIANFAAGRNTKGRERLMSSKEGGGRFRWLRKLSFLKYIVVGALGVLLVGFLGDNSLLAHMRNKERINGLQKEIRSLRQQHKRATEKLRRMDSDPLAVEEIARERYYMKRADEDIFVLSDDMGKGEEGEYSESDYYEAVE